MSSVKEFLKFPTDSITSPPELKTSESDDIILNKISRSEMSLANYHSEADEADNFSVKTYNSLLKRRNALNPTEKADGDFAN